MRCATGAQLGTVLGLLVTGLLSASSWGWTSVFYVAGATGLLWCLAWYLLGWDSPSQHPSIGEAERSYILEHTAMLTSGTRVSLARPGPGH